MIGSRDYFALGQGKGKKPGLVLEFRFPLQPQGKILGRERGAEAEMRLIACPL